MHKTISGAGVACECAQFARCNDEQNLYTVHARTQYDFLLSDAILSGRNSAYLLHQEFDDQSMLA